MCKAPSVSFKTSLTREFIWVVCNIVPWHGGTQGLLIPGGPKIRQAPSHKRGRIATTRAGSRSTYTQELLSSHGTFKATRFPNCSR